MATEGLEEARCVEEGREHLIPDLIPKNESQVCDSCTSIRQLSNEMVVKVNRVRLGALDMLRGTIMIIMAWDHTKVCNMVRVTMALCFFSFS